MSYHHTGTETVEITTHYHRDGSAFYRNQCTCGLTWTVSLPIIATNEALGHERYHVARAAS